MRGVVRVLTASDIPGQNNTMPGAYKVEELLCSGQVMYAGQAVAIVVAGKYYYKYSELVTNHSGVGVGGGQSSSLFYRK